MFERRRNTDGTVYGQRVLTLVSTVLLVITQGEVPGVAAGWLTTPSSRTAKDDEAPQPSSAFEAAVRRLMETARVQMQEGRIDEAIEIADRASRMSQQYSKEFKLSADVGPEATAKFARELRLRKSKAVAKKTISSPPGRPMRGTNQSPETPSQTAEFASTASHGPVVNAARRFDLRTRSSKIRNATESSSRNESFAETTPPAPSTSSIPEQWTDSLPPSLIPKASDVSVALSTDGDERIDDRPGRAVVVSSQYQVVGEVAPFVLDDLPEPGASEAFPQITPQTPVTTKISRSRQKSLERATRIKLRPRNVPADGTAEGLNTASRENRSIKAQGPRVVPRAKPPSAEERNAPRVLQDDTESKSAHPIHDNQGNNDEDIVPSPTPQTIKQIGYTVEDESVVDNEDVVLVSFLEVEVKEAETAEPNATAVPDEDLVGSSFPTQSVLELQQRLDSVMSLNPGMVIPATSTDLLTDTFRDSDETSPLVVKVRKRRSTRPDSPIEETTRASASSIRQPVVGKTSLIKWRSAKDGTVERMVETTGKSTGSVNDLRQSVSEVTESNSAIQSVSTDQATVTSPSVALGTTDDDSVRNSNQRDRTGAGTELHGTLWDYALAPAIRKESSHFGARTSTLPLAGPVPSPPVELGWEESTADSPGELAIPQDEEQSDGEVNRESNRSEARTNLATLLFEEQLDDKCASKSLLATDMLDADEVASTGERVEFPDHVEAPPASKATSKLGMIGMVIFIAGLWTVRSVVRARNS
jgi:hypothetical protein